MVFFLLEGEGDEVQLSHLGWLNEGFFKRFAIKSLLSDNFYKERCFLGIYVSENIPT